MKYFNGLVFFAVMAYLVWPMYTFYQLNEAVKKNDKAALETLVDLTAVNEVYQENLKWKSEHFIGSKENLLPEIAREGTQVIANAAGNLAANVLTIDINWIINQLRKSDGSPWQQLTFAFFESPTRFTIRFGQLGHNPIHIQMTLQDWYWRVAAIYL